MNCSKIVTKTFLLPGKSRQTVSRTSTTHNIPGHISARPSCVHAYVCPSVVWEQLADELIGLKFALVSVDELCTSLICCRCDCNKLPSKTKQQNRLYRL